MSYISQNLRCVSTACVAAVIAMTAVSNLSQESANGDKFKADRNEYKTCAGNNWSNGERVSFTEARQISLPATGTVNVNAGQNGGISVKGEDRSDVLVIACVQAWSTSEEAAKAAVAGIKINTSGEVRAENPSGDKNWSVSYRILVPRSTNTSLTAHNGGISVSDVDGKAEFETMNGGLTVNNVSGSVRGRTANGGVNVTLSGRTWKGSGLDVQTTNGGVNLIIPENYAANIETGTVNGGYRSAVPSLNVTTEDFKGDSYDRARTRSVKANLNGGGAPIRVVTTNGGVRISTPN